jgi:hypothetical protein
VKLEGAKAVELRYQCDRQGALALMRNPTNHPRAKHIDVCLHFIRELIMRGEIQVSYCPTEDILADMFKRWQNAGMRRIAAGLVWWTCESSSIRFRGSVVNESKTVLEVVALEHFRRVWTSLDED